MRLALVVSFVIVGTYCLAPHAMAQVSHVSASRIVYASGSRSGEPGETETYSTTEVGNWSARADTWLSGVDQTSFIGPRAVEYRSAIGAGGGAGHTGAAESVLEWVFETDRTMRWGVTYSYDNLPVSPGAISLIRSGSNVNRFAGVDWYDGFNTPMHAAGFLEAGRYTVRIRALLVNAGFGTNETFTFGLTVPGPSAFSVIAIAGLGLRRRR
jgi:hypothetical protein